MSLKTTPLNDEHRRLGATLVDFAGYEMPISYNQFSGGIRQEHLLVRENAGIFDVSHMGEFRIRGSQAAQFLSFACTRSVEEMKLGRAQYALLLNKEARILDDVLVYKNSENDFMMVVNASNRKKDWDHLYKLSEDFDLTLTDESDLTALIAIQGPKAADLVDDILPGARDLKYYSFFKTATNWIVARTGYTGEDGFEIFLPNEEAPTLWKILLEKGIKPIGLGARDTLRLEVGFPLYGHELSEDLMPHETLASFAVNKNGSFLGADVLYKAAKRYKPVALLGETAKPFREGEKIFYKDQVVGRITSGSTSPGLKKGMALGLLETSKCPEESLVEGTHFKLESGNKDRQAVLTNLPFVETARVKPRKHSST